MSPVGGGSEPRDFFISYNGADEPWAEWIAWTLSYAGYTHYFQKWDFRPGGNFVLEMQRAAADSERTLLVMTAKYLGALFTQPEWAAALAKDPTGEKRLIVPIRVERCEPAGMLRPLVYCDLVDLAIEEARSRLLAALLPSGKPATAPIFPGPASPAASLPGITASPAASFPGPATTVEPSVDSLRVAAEELRSILATSRATFVAQARLRNQLAERIRVRLAIREPYQFEELFDRTFDWLEPAESRLHRTIRAYTVSVLHEYNQRALDTLEREPRLASVLPSFDALKQHLVLWLSKFEHLFLQTPSMCLLYVGVEERLGFPRQIEAELGDYLRTGSPA